MNIKQYLLHILDWLCHVPLPRANEHITTGVAGGGAYRCIVCGYTEKEDEK